jgi:hypothetical protein
MEITMIHVDDDIRQRQQARWAGALYLLVVIIAPLGIVYVPSKLFVPGDASATAAAVRSSLGLLRAGIASELVHQTIEVFLILALYRLLKPVQESWAKQMLALGLISIPIVFANTLNEIAAIVLLGGYPFLAPFTAPQLEVLAYLFMRLHGAGITVASVFWGLWLLPFGALILRSSFGARIVGVLVLIAGGAYVLNAFATLVLPQTAQMVSMVATPLEAGELAGVLWLVIVGARRSKPEGSRAAPGGA